MKKISSFIISVLLVQALNAQTLFTFGDYKVDKKEFAQFYADNNFDKNKYSQESIDNYINMYALYRMKIIEAQNLRLDTIPKIKSEILALKKQLAKPYFVDQNVMNDLLDEVKSRYNTEVEIAHIQITTWGNDTAEAYTRIQQIYKDIQSKKISFEDAVAQFSDDGYSKAQNGYLGYVSALDIKYEIENAAFSTAPGQISKPFKTNNAYHIVKVINKRPALGKLHVAQILVKPSNPTVPEAVDEAKALAEKLLSELKNGADFNTYVQKYSQDHLTKDNNGIIAPFNPGTYQLQFEEVAFNLNDKNPYGAIVHTEFGFHIIKFISRESKPDFAQVQSQLTTQLKSSNRVAIAEKKLKDNQLKAMNFKEHPQHFSTLIDWITADSSKVIDLNKKDISQLSKVLFSLNKKDYTQADFIRFTIDATGGQIYGKKDESITQLYDLYKNNILETTHLEELYKNNAEYRTAFERDRNGILIFELMNQRVFQKSNEDLDGILEYYNANSSKYTYNPAFEGYILETESKEALVALLPHLTDYNTIRETIFEFNQESPFRVDHINGKYEYSLMPNLKTDNLTALKPSDIFMTPNGKYSVIIPEKLIPAGTIKPFSEARVHVANDYQTYLDEQWSKELLNKYPLKVNSKVAQTIKK